MIPWDTFETPLDAYEWAKTNLCGFNYGGAIEPWTKLYLTPLETTAEDGFYTDFSEDDCCTGLRLPVRR